MRYLWTKLFPILKWWPDVNRDTLRADTMAGITGAIVVLPQGVAFAAIAGMPPEYGLYAAMVPAIIAAFFGSSRQLVSGPTTAASIVLFSTLASLAVPGTPDYIRYALTLTFMVGVLELAMGLARLGGLVNFISHAVIVGFTAGAAVLIGTSQLKNFFGIAIPGGLHIHEAIMFLANHIGETHVLTLVVGIVTLVSGLACKRWWPRIPYMIVAMLSGSLVAAAFNGLHYFGLLGGQAGGLGIRVVGAIPATLPPLSAPDLSFSVIKELAPAAFAVTLFALTEAVSISRSLASKSGELIDGNQEFVGQGLSNIVGSFFSSYVATGSFNRSGINYEAGAKTPIAAILAGLLLMVVVIVVAPLLAFLPNAAMAAILFMVAWGIIDFHHFAKITKTSRKDSVVLWGTFFATLLFELDFAILLGVFLSLVIYLRRASRPRVLVRVPDPSRPRRRFNTNPSLPECPQLVMVHIEGAIFFGAVNYVSERLRIIGKRNPVQKHLLILARSVNFIDVAGAEMLAREGRLRVNAGGAVYFHQLGDGVRSMLERGGYLQEMGKDVTFESKGEAIAEIFNRMDRSICRRCDKRIFNECGTVPRDPVAES